MFKNILHNPAEVTEYEVDCLNKRRKLEKHLILDRDLDSHQDKYWFIISSDWLQKWKCFIANKRSSSHKEMDANDHAECCMGIRESSNPVIGILPPGPISNIDLFIKKAGTNDYEMRKNLLLNKHYRVVNREVW